MSATRWRSSSPTTPRTARDAAEAIGVDYDILPSATELATALDAGQPLVWPGSGTNQVFDWAIGDKAATDAEFAKAAHVTRLKIINNRVVVASMEARAAVGQFDPATGRWTLTTNTQGGWLVKDIIAGIFKTEAERFRVVTPDVGGGFGMKIFLYAEHVLVCYAAQKLGQPVKWASDRNEAFLSDTHGRDNITVGELAIDADGKLLALRTRNVANMGAYLSTFAPYIPTFAGTGVLASVYGFKAVYANVIGVFTNTVPVDAYRGAGRPESNYLVERLVDAGGAGSEGRPRRVPPPQHGPALGDAAQDSGRQALRQRRFPHRARRRPEEDRLGRLRRPQGRGGAPWAEARHRPRLLSGGDRRRPTERAEIRFADDGFVDVLVGTQSTGQGHETAYVQLTVDRLGVPGEKVRVDPGRHGHDPDRRRHRRRTQPLFRGPGDPAHRRDGDREGQAGGIRSAGSGRRRHRVRRWTILPSPAPTAASTS